MTNVGITISRANNRKDSCRPTIVCFVIRAVRRLEECRGNIDLRQFHPWRPRKHSNTCSHPPRKRRCFKIWTEEITVGPFRELPRTLYTISINISLTVSVGVGVVEKQNIVDLFKYEHICFPVVFKMSHFKPRIVLFYIKATLVQIFCRAIAPFSLTCNM